MADAIPSGSGGGGPPEKVQKLSKAAKKKAKIDDLVTEIIRDALSIFQLKDRYPDEDAKYLERVWGYADWKRYLDHLKRKGAAAEKCSASGCASCSRELNLPIPQIILPPDEDPFWIFFHHIDYAFFGPPDPQDFVNEERRQHFYWRWCNMDEEEKAAAVQAAKNASAAAAGSG